MESLKNTLKQLAPLTNEELDKFIALAKPQKKKFFKDSYFCKVGDPKVQLGFILNGLFRVFINTFEGQVYVRDFRSENQFLGAYASMILNKPVNINIQAIEDSEILVMDALTARKIFDNNSNWQQVGRIIAEHFYCQYEERDISHMTESAETRYDKFTKSHAYLLNRLSQKDIAHYLGINPVSLSRIRGSRVKK